MIGSGGPSTGRRALGATVLALLLAADALLVGLALRPRTPPPAALPAVPHGVAPAAASSPEPARPVATALAAAGTEALWRYAAGCDHPPGLQRSTDGGRHWTDLTAPAAHLLRLVATGRTALWAVAADASCTPAYVSSRDGGATWRRGDGLSGAWLLLPTGVRAPGAVTVRPCGGTLPDALAPATATLALARCGDALRRTADGGRTWTSVTDPVGHSVAVAAAGHRRWLSVQRAAAGCRGLRVDRSTDAGGHWLAGRCLPAAAEPVALSVDDAGAGVLVAGGALWTTTDSGAHWWPVAG